MEEIWHIRPARDAELDGAGRSLGALCACDSWLLDRSRHQMTFDRKCLRR